MLVNSVHITRTRRSENCRRCRGRRRTVLDARFGCSDGVWATATLTIGELVAERVRGRVIDRLKASESENGGISRAADGDGARERKRVLGTGAGCGAGPLQTALP